jgi:hypothetical protein
MAIKFSIERFGGVGHVFRFNPALAWRDNRNLPEVVRISYSLPKTYISGIK